MRICAATARCQAPESVPAPEILFLYIYAPVFRVNIFNWDWEGVNFPAGSRDIDRFENANGDRWFIIRQCLWTR